jgi:hypothetical protein
MYVNEKMPIFKEKMAKKNHEEIVERKKYTNEVCAYDNYSTSLIRKMLTKTASLVTKISKNVNNLPLERIYGKPVHFRHFSTNWECNLALCIKFKNAYF